MAPQSKVKILFVADPNSIHNVKWMSYFADKTNLYKVYVCCETNESPSQQVINQLNEQHIQFTEIFPPFSIRTPWKNYKSYKKFLALTQSLSIDCVHVLFATPYALWLRRYKGFSVITTRGSDVLRVLPELQSRGKLKGLYHRYLMKYFSRAFHHAALITSTSNRQIEAVSALFGLKSQLIRTGVDVPLIKQAMSNYPCVTDQRFRLFSPRFVQPIYGITLQLEALKLLSPRELTKIHFLGIIGKQANPTYVNEVKELLIALEKRGLTWELLDFLTPTEMISAIKAADLILMTPESDGTPNTALEAMAAGRPLIVSDLPYDEELFTGTCWRLTPRNPTELVKLIQHTMLGNYPNHLLSHALHQVEKYGNREVEMQKLEKLVSMGRISE